MVFRGVASIVFGVLALVYPGIALATLVLLFGAYALVDGGAMVVWSIARHRTLPYWGALLVGGILGIAAGVVTFLWPAMTAVGLLFVIAAWAITIGITTIVMAVRLRKEITGEGLLVLTGILSVALGVILIASPAAGALAMVIWISMYAIVAGLLLVTLGWRLRRWCHAHSAGMAAHPA
jgi:uncharacterized membrane protein HdeD (DUF308 family)